MKIAVANLRKVTERILLHLELTGQSVVEIPMEHYWEIPREGRYDSYDQPSEFTLGQLSDTWDNLQKLETAEREPIVYDLVGLAAILRAVGESVNEA
jgi:hypothetical protein